MSFLLKLPARLKLWAYAIGASLAAAWAIYAKGRADQRAREVTRDMREDIKAHERINQADTGAGLNDDERRERLREFAAKHGTGSPKAGGR